MRTGNLWAVLLSVFFAGAALAIEASPPSSYARNGFYVGVGATYAIENFHDIGSTSAGNSWGANAHVGYRVLPLLGLELQTEWAEGFDLGGSDVGTWAVMANARGYVTEARVQPFLLLGAGMLNASGAGASGTGFAGRVGGGVEIWLTEHIALLGEGSWVAATGAVSDLDYGSILWGLEYRF